MDEQTRLQKRIKTESSFGDNFTNGRHVGEGDIRPPCGCRVLNLIIGES